MTLAGGRAIAGELAAVLNAEFRSDNSGVSESAGPVRISGLRHLGAADNNNNKGDDADRSTLTQSSSLGPPILTIILIKRANTAFRAIASRGSGSIGSLTPRRAALARHSMARTRPYTRKELETLRRADLQNLFKVGV